MKIRKSVLILFFALALCFIPAKNIYAGASGGIFEVPESDNDQNLYIVAFFDLRDRETFIQTTITANTPATLHIQIFDVSNNCNENNFFDDFTGNDSHIYNMRDIQTNDGNPSGVVLPDGAYGIVVIANFGGKILVEGNLIGNFRILDDTGYEYRTNMQSFPNIGPGSNPDNVLTFNFNINSGVVLSDVVGIIVGIDEPDVTATNITDIYVSYDIDIYNNNEVPFSCRDVTFACTDQNNPLLEELLEESQTNVASFEYGINDTIPHSRESELLCPGNNVSEGFVRMRIERLGNGTDTKFFYVGLNNGNGRGSMDGVWDTGRFTIPTPG